jgi:hypothetical protein
LATAVVSRPSERRKMTLEAEKGTHAVELRRQLQWAHEVQPLEGDRRWK